MAFRIIIVVFTAAFFLEGCNREIANRNLEQVRTQYESRRKWRRFWVNLTGREKGRGRGNRSENSDGTYAYYYEQDDQTIVLRFSEWAFGQRTGRIQANINMEIPSELESRIDEVITHYPVSKRSASLPLLHLIQEHFGYISDEAINGLPKSSNCNRSTSWSW